MMSLPTASWIDIVNAMCDFETMNPSGSLTQIAVGQRNEDTDDHSNRILAMTTTTALSMQ